MSETTEFNRLKRSVVANDAIEILKTMILKGQLVAHQRLPPERELAEMLGVSRPTLRESIRALIALNILESRHGEGTFVTSLDPGLLSEPIDFVLRLTPTQLRDLAEVRAIFEPATARLAAKRMNPEILERLGRIVEEFSENLETTDDFKTGLCLDAEFHELIAKASGNAILITMASATAAMTRESRARTAQRRSDRVRACDELREIHRTLRKGDPDAAAEAMANHITHIAEVVQTLDADVEPA